MPLYTMKDQTRVASLLAFLQAHGLVAAERKAVNDAEKINHIVKCEARAALLVQARRPSLAAPFQVRAQWLRAQGVRE